MLHEMDENRLSGAKPNSVKVTIFRGTTEMKDDMKIFLKLYLLSTIHQLSVILNKL